jgi:hypothetical protein
MTDDVNVIEIRTVQDFERVPAEQLQDALEVFAAWVRLNRRLFPRGRGALWSPAVFLFRPLP